MRSWLTVFVVLSVGCGSSDGESPLNQPLEDSGGTVDVAADSALADTASPSETGGECPRTPKPEGARKVVVSHPFLDGGMKTGAMEVLDLAADGTLTRPMKTFALGAAAFEPIVFTPDGELGFVGLDNGAIGSFKLDASGNVSVLNPALKGSFYAGKLVVDPNGQHLYAVDSNTEENGGGIYAFDIACDGTLGAPTKIVAAKSWQALAFLNGDPSRALAAGADAHLLKWGATPSPLGNAGPFPDKDAIPSWLDIMPDNKFALIADNGILVGNRVAVVSIAAAAIAPVSVFTLDNPVAVVASPFNNAALVLNSDGKDGFTILRYDGSTFTNGGKLVYAYGKPALPSNPTMITRGPLKGRVLLAENVAVRQLQFTTDGAINDISKLSYPSGIPNIVGTVGVQP
jgi:hypothetical protein